MSQKRNSIPWAAGVGLLSIALGVITLLSGGASTPAIGPAIVLLVLGVVGVLWGYSSRDKERRHKELLAEMRAERDSSRTD